MTTVRRGLKRASWAGRNLARRLALSKLSPRSSTRRAALVGRPDQWAIQRRFQFDFLTSRDLRPEHRLIDIGCGTLRGGIPLIEYLETGNYTGVEVRAAALEAGRKELRERGLEHKQPRLVHATDPRQIEPGAPFDFAWAFMVLIHMPDDVVDAYLRFVSQRLTETGEFYANVAIGDAPQGEWQGFPVVSRRGEFYEGLAAPHGLRISEVGRLNSLGHRVGRGGNTTMLRFARAPRLTARS